jgi:hypothetical protein
VGTLVDTFYLESIADGGFDRFTPIIVYLYYSQNVQANCEKNAKMSGNVSKIIFISLIIIFIPVLIDLTSPSMLNFPDVINFILLVVLFLLGLLFLIIVLRNPDTGLLRRYLILTALNAIAIPVAVIFHDLLGDSSGTREDIFFFFTAVIICPLGFVTGIIGSFILFLKSAQKPAKET